MFEIEDAYTTETVDFSNQSVFVCLFERWFTNTPFPPLPQCRRATKEMAGKEMKVLQGKVNKHKELDDKGIHFCKSTQVQISTFKHLRAREWL